MIASMTGYGKSAYADDKMKVSVEIKSINSKQLDLTLRLPAIFRDQETLLRNRLSQLLERGKVEVSVNYENLQDAALIKINEQIIRQYKNNLDKIIEELDIPVPHEYLSLLVRLPEALSANTPEAEEEQQERLLEIVSVAADSLMASRLNEGKGLYSFFFDKIERIRGYLELTEKFESGRVSRIREKLEQQLAKLVGVEYDRARLEQELIFYIEKLDISEEKQRLRSHLDYFEETLGEPDENSVSGKGKKLGFISQEMGREINTLGSKSNDAGMQKLVVMMKDELEQIKEQVLNVL